MSRTHQQRSLAEQIGPDRGWFAVQMAVYAATFLAGPAGLIFGRPHLPWPRLIDIVAGLVLMLGGLRVAGQAHRDLGEAMRVAPTPHDDATLADRGWYGRVRHPLYLANGLLTLGWALAWSSVVGLAVTLLSLVFFSLKARHEERLLVSRYPDYPDYMRRVRWRFIPGVW